jgi:hypothetical protein
MQKANANADVMNGYQLSDAAAARASGFFQRHGMGDLTSSGSINGVDQGSIDRRPNATGSRQATGASDVSDKVAKLQKSCAHEHAERVGNAIMCKSCAKTWRSWELWKAEPRASLQKENTVSDTSADLERTSRWLQAHQLGKAEADPRRVAIAIVGCSHALKTTRSDGQTVCLSCDQTLSSFQKAAWARGGDCNQHQLIDRDGTGLFCKGCGKRFASAEAWKSERDAFHERHDAVRSGEFFRKSETEATAIASSFEAEQFRKEVDGLRGAILLGLAQDAQRETNIARKKELIVKAKALAAMSASDFAKAAAPALGRQTATDRRTWCGRQFAA